MKRGLERGTLKGTLSCLIYQRGIQQGTCADFFLNMEAPAGQAHQRKAANNHYFHNFSIMVWSVKHQKAMKNTHH